MQNFRLLSVLALSAICTGAVANDYLTDEVFGDAEVTIDGNSLTYAYPDAEEGIWDLFMDAYMWRNQSKDITYCMADGTVIETSHIGSWDNTVTFTCDLDFSNGQYVSFPEGVFQIDVNDDEGETYERYYSPAYIYKEEGSTVGINSTSTSKQGFIYNLEGIRLEQFQQGLNVVNGRTVIVK